MMVTAMQQHALHAFLNVLVYTLQSYLGSALMGLVPVPWMGRPAVALHHPLCCIHTRAHHGEPAARADLDCPLPSIALVAKPTPWHC